MLTYRQLLQKCNKDTLRALLTDKTRTDIFYKEVPADEMEAQVVSTVDAYMRVVETMINKKGEWPAYAIILELVADQMYDEATFELTGESVYYISTNYYNSTTEEVPMNQPDKYYHDERYQKFMGFGLSPWAEFVDSDIVISPEVATHLGLDNFFEKIATEILWEQTWHGFTEEDNQEFSDMLKQRVKDIKSGKLKTKKMKRKKGDKYTVRIPEDMLAPTKKKRSNKKK
jgi:hypothetical protein